MSNGKDKPGEYLALPIPATADEIKALAEAQEPNGFYVVAANDSFLIFYKKGH